MMQKTQPYKSLKCSPTLGARGHSYEIRRRHPSVAFGKHFYLFRVRRMGGAGAHWHAGSGSVWQKENVHGGGVSHSYVDAHGLRGEGNYLPAG